MTLPHLSSYDRTGAQSSLNGVRPTASPPTPQGGLIGAAPDPPVGPPGAFSVDTIDVRPTAAPEPPSRPQVRQDFAKLVDSVNQGNIGAALSALESLQGHSPGLYEKTGKPTNAGSPFSNELDQLMKSLKAGDEAGAKSALARLEKEMETAHERRRAEENPLAGGITAIGQSSRHDGDGDRDRAGAADRELKTA